MSTAPNIALMAALPLPDQSGAPEWVHLLPPPGPVTTFDGRGPYVLGDLAAVLQASLDDPRGLPIDENHATDIAAPKGGSAPARGWIVELQARDTGIWGRVQWTREGGALVADRAYRGLSPVLAIDARDKKTIRAIRRASLVNLPNLRDLTALNQETSMSFMEQLAEKLGLPKDATEDQILAAIGGDKTALQSALTEIGTVLGVEGDQATIVAAARARASASGTLTALQAENAQLSARLATIEAANKRAASQAWLTAKLARQAIPATDHDTLLSLHMEKPETAERVAALWPALGATVPNAQPPAAADPITSLNADQRTAADLLGIPHATYLATLQAEQKDRR
jgi:phage I-like protein